MTDQPVHRITDEAMRSIEDGRLDECSHIYTRHERSEDKLLVTLAVDANEHELTNWLRTVQACPCQMCRIITSELTTDG